MPNLCIFPARALNDPSLTPTDIKVLAAIGTHTDRAGAGCWANSKTLSEEAGVSQSTFFAATKRLLDAGLIERSSGQLQGRSSDYRVLLDAPRVSSKPDTQVSGQPDTPPPAPQIPASGQPDTPTINDPLNDPLNESSPALDASGLPFLVDGYGPDLDELELKITKSNGSIRSWRAEMAAALQGMHGPKATPLQVSQAIRHFAGNGAEISLRLFGAYLRSSVAGPRESPAQGKPGGKNEPYKPGWLVRKEQDDEDAVLNRDPNTKAVVDVAIATKGQEWWNKMKREAKDLDRFVYPYAFLTLKKEQG